MIDVLGIGCAAVDDVLYVDTYPSADSKLQIKRSERRFGGLTAIALIAAAKLGGRCAFAGLLGEDELSRSVEDNFIRHGIDVSHAVRRPESRPVHATIVAAEETGTRNIFFEASAPTGAHSSGPSEEVIRASKVLFLDYLGVAGGIRAATVARKAGVPVVGDLEDDRDPDFGELLVLVDHLIIGREFATRLTGVDDPQVAVEKLMTPGRETAVVTCGNEGAWYASRRPEPPFPFPAQPSPQEEGGTARHQPAFPVKAVDTTGCGDVFHGAYALALARGESVESRVRFAAAAAAVKATQAEVPSAEQVIELLARPTRVERAKDQRPQRR
ncbi:MAG TPA: PfkB family carbohydrate kinase [Fimbriimonadaceae bacterium]|nr:PfkB family carbohydrate kinase [Fimbriimonadaceae bacterium]